jgi:hypothetical protein
MLKTSEMSTYSKPVLKRALALYEQDQAQWRGGATAGPDVHGDIPPEYFERAVLEIAASARRNRTVTAAVVCGVAVCVGAAFAVNRMDASGLIGLPKVIVDGAPGSGSILPAAHAAGASAFPFTPGLSTHVPGRDTIPGWRLIRNIDTEAFISVVKDAPDHSYAHITVGRFVPDNSAPGGARFPLDLETEVIRFYMMDSTSMVFRARANGLTGIRAVLSYRGGGDRERWISRTVMLSPDWRTYRVDLRRLRHFTRSGDGQPWRGAGVGAPSELIDDLGFEMGEEVNDVGAHGMVEVGDIVLQ